MDVFLQKFPLTIVQMSAMRHSTWAVCFLFET